ncbi:hypothetical protein SAMN02910436_00622 [Ruminococcaceae bacterium P7]|nr:hypothetical protein SAMN02910436_00622 [Ruminococcaceae bacterium P7]
MLCAAVFVLGLISLTVAVARDGEQWQRAFRFMTVIGTLYTTLLSGVVFAVTLRKRDRADTPLFFLRLCAAVSECVIAIVILLSFLPFIPDSPDIFRFDSFVMHVAIPLLTVISFVVCARPAGDMPPLTHFNGSWLLVVYSAVVTALIITGVMPTEDIPYSFLEISTRPLWYVLLSAGIIFGTAYFLSFLLSAVNRRLSVRR